MPENEEATMTRKGLRKLCLKVNFVKTEAKCLDLEA